MATTTLASLVPIFQLRGCRVPKVVLCMSCGPRDHASQLTDIRLRICSGSHSRDWLVIRCRGIELTEISALRPSNALTLPPKHRPIACPPQRPAPLTVGIHTFGDSTHALCRSHTLGGYPCCQRRRDVQERERRGWYRVYRQLAGPWFGEKHTSPSRAKK